jgi:AcrR family transcriptional regulator
MVRKVPTQARSIDSMNRMLDAGEQLFYEGGSPALTLEAVIERSQTSTGSFYARFGDMHGFLEAMHERVLEIIASEMVPHLAKVAAQPDLESAMLTYSQAALELVDRHKAPVYFFVVGHSHDEAARALGAQFSLASRDVFVGIVQSFLPNASSAVAKRRIEMAFRTIYATMFQYVMLDQSEISRIPMSRNMVATELATIISGYLRSIPAK